MRTFKTRANEIRGIEKEFGFYIRHKHYATKIRRMAEEIYILRESNRSMLAKTDLDSDRIRGLELQIADLDRRLNG